MGITADKIDSAIERAVFAPEEEVRQQHRRDIKALAASLGVYPASIQGLYEAAGKGLYQNKTVPAINLRGLTYQSARSVFRAALAEQGGRVHLRDRPLRDRLYEAESRQSTPPACWRPPSRKASRGRSSSRGTTTR